MRVEAGTDERLRVSAAVLGGLFDKQRAAVLSTSKRIAAHPGRRGGKSAAIPPAAFAAALWAGRINPVIIGAEHREKAVALHWGNCQALIQDLGLTGWRSDSAKAQITTPYGGIIQFWGMKDKRSSILLRGYQPYEAHFDEVASYAHLLEGMVDDDIGPALGDVRHLPRGGRLFLWGTPSHTRVGYWFEACCGIRREWEVHHWDVRDNPHYHDPDGFLRETLERHGWDETHPTYQREYLGRFVDDAAALVYRFDRLRNVAPLPDDYDPERWIHVIGVDFGMVDECAWVVIASHPHSRDTWVVHVEKAADLLTDAAADRTAELVERYRPDAVVGDAGGLGKPYVEQIRRRHGIPMEPAEKAEKLAHIRLINADLGTGRLRMAEMACQALIEEISSLPWNESRTREDPRYPNHACDALLYAWRRHTAFSNQRPPEPDSRLSDPSSPEAIAREYARYQREQDRAWWDRD